MKELQQILNSLSNKVGTHENIWEIVECIQLLDLGVELCEIIYEALLNEYLGNRIGSAGQVKNIISKVIYDKTPATKSVQRGGLFIVFGILEEVSLVSEQFALYLCKHDQTVRLFTETSTVNNDLFRRYNCIRRTLEHADDEFVNEVEGQSAIVVLDRHLNDDFELTAEFKSVIDRISLIKPTEYILIVDSSLSLGALQQYRFISEQIGTDVSTIAAKENLCYKKGALLALAHESNLLFNSIGSNVEDFEVFDRDVIIKSLF